MDVLLDEIESLEAILMDDVKIIKHGTTNFPELIETTVLPTVGEETERQYVCVTLQVMPTADYPDVSPQFKLKNPRGLDDHSINAIEQSVKNKLKESIGLPVVFDLIDIVREHLTTSNLPSGQCVVCLYGFQEGDQFTKTNCYHFLHTYCLARHLIASKKNYQEEQDKLPAWQRKQSKPYHAVCPVCRELIDNDIDPLLSAEPPAELENAPKFQLTNELKHLQSKMADLFLHQKIRGGIIDLDAAENNVISIEDEDEINERRKNNFNNEDGNNSNQSTVPPATEVFVTQSRASSNSPVPNQNHHRFPHHRGTHRPLAPEVVAGSGGGDDNAATEIKQSNDNQNSYNQNNHHHHHHHGHHHHHRHHGGYSNRSYNRNRRGVHNAQTNAQQPCSSNNR